MTVDIKRRGAARRYTTADMRNWAAELLAALKQNRAELSILLVGDKEMRPLNAKYRDKNETTDVLSFPCDPPVRGRAMVLGDVVISIDQARRQAGVLNKTLESVMATLLIHGVLHLLGYDHERSQRQARLMKKLEQKLYRGLCEQGFLRV